MKFDGVVFESEKLNLAYLGEDDTIHVFGFVLPINPKHRTHFLELFVSDIQDIGLSIPSLHKRWPHVLPHKLIPMMNVQDVLAGCVGFIILFGAPLGFVFLPLNIRILMLLLLVIKIINQRL